MRQVTVLGATGSIGESTLDVLARHPARFSVFALTANTQVDSLYQQCLKHRPSIAVMRDPESAAVLKQRLAVQLPETAVLSGEAGLRQVAAAPEADVVMAAIVGAAGLGPTLAAVEAGKQVLLANKEALVMAGALFMSAVERHGASLLPIDSEHNAIFQCMPAEFSRDLPRGGIRRILLTGSGGPFREAPLEDFPAITPDQACAHPNWSMGRKISVDSATMMNKGLELIEACWLFNTGPESIDIVVHPQSVIHSMVEYVDGSVLAQLGNPDMRTPIAHALAWPERIDSGVSSLDIIAQARLDFQAPDPEKFPALRLAREAAEQGGTAAATLNAANEVAVDAFLNGEISFDQIPEICAFACSTLPVVAADSLATVLKADSDARALAMDWIANPGIATGTTIVTSEATAGNLRSAAMD